MVMVIDPFFWFLMRLVTGICFASLFANVESWINAQVTNNNRARTLAIYRFVDLGAVTLSQYMLPVFGIGGFEIFAVMTMLIILSIVPVSLADPVQPRPAGAVLVQPEASVRGLAPGLRGCDYRRPDHCLVPLRRPALCGGLGFRGVRYRLVHECGHHRRDRAAVSAGLSV
jgi:MFS family permease